MLYRKSFGAITLAGALGMAAAGAPAQNPVADAARYDAAKYPDWSGQWRRPETGPNRYDPSKPPGRAQRAPLMPEFQAIFEAGLADQKEGGSGTNVQAVKQLIKQFDQMRKIMRQVSQGRMPDLGALMRQSR